uniref:Variant surface glycoprotein n=1 Tax=Trypanosoma brucei TaxID=5691 RepID=S5FYC6_9TRYP|nr:variant surface glycoprotein [Trypanosoma brucei]
MILRIVLTIIFSAANAKAANENAREFRAMCWLYNLLSTPPPEPVLESGTDAATKSTLQEKINSIKTDILMLNLTVADNEVLATLKDTSKYANQAATQESGKKVAYFTGITEEKFAAMRKAHAKLFEEGQEGDKRRKAYNLPITAALKTKIAPIFYRLEQQADLIVKEAEFSAARIKTARAAATQAQAEALFGATYSPKITSDTALEANIPEPQPANFPWNGGTRDAVCAKAAAENGKAGKALATDILCLCLPMHKNDSTNYCETKGTAPSSSTPISTPTLAAAEFDKIKATCKETGQGQSKEPTGPRLQAATARIFAMLGANRQGQTGGPNNVALNPEEGGILGVHEFYQTKPGCTANNAAPLTQGGNGICISYHNLLKDAGGIPWTAKITEAEQQLTKVHTIFNQAISLIGHAEAIKNQMTSLLLMGDLITVVQGTLPTASTQPTIEEQNKCKNPPNKTAEGCAAIDCDYDKTKKECKPKPGSETRAAEKTGDAAAATTDKCRRHNQKAACEAEPGDPPKGKAKVCGWIDYVDGEGKLDPPQCRSSSFLLNKQFALTVVSAAFVALLF